ncbi:MAG: encapsulin-associated ferritin-like protein [Candidatus Eisenbacteria bacterium]|nr:ferritin-like domain-containing protein [Candidatus Eisenbacteria bacterium]
MEGYHEPYEILGPETSDLHRALTSLKEEIEAIDWYHQRVVAAHDPALRDVLTHNRDEEIEHATMVLEWLRRNMPGWDRALRAYLFREEPITEIEEEDKAGGERREADLTSPAPSQGSVRHGRQPIPDLGIGKLQEEA